jgi:hypothetical protein
VNVNVNVAVMVLYPPSSPPSLTFLILPTHSCSPLGNDRGLTLKHDSGIPFVSVYSSARTPSSAAPLSDSNNADGDNKALTVLLSGKVPEALVPCHVGGNELGSAAILARLVSLNRAGLPLLASAQDTAGVGLWLTPPRVAELVVLARQDLLDM